MRVFADWCQSFADQNTAHKLVIIAGGAAAVLTTGVVLKKVFFRKKKKEYPRDVVILHGIMRGPYAPSLSPYVMKLETYLRIAKLPYQIELDGTPSKKGKWPWIEYNGEEVTDSEFCIRYLNSKFNIDLNRHLSVYDKAVAESVKIMTDEHMAWCYAMFRYFYDEKATIVRKAFKMPRIVFWYLRRQARAAFYYQGTGRHNKDEVRTLLNRDLEVIENILGPRKFLMGDRPCDADCAVFGHLAQIYWHCKDNDEMETYLADKFPTLVAYCERMKTNYWLDWDDCITRGFTVKATK